MAFSSERAYSHFFYLKNYQLRTYSYLCVSKNNKDRNHNAIKFTKEFTRY